ncbi:hypothetical protein KUM39_23590 [Streptomyces sp. J2-1]|uniref:SCO2583 family membrane protein n=1 Tax=Streptomyces corallincola TaxID=2851888 RepID=UPI001C3867B9|nr:hypothetical protein [Streptomyces corallincola]MBV2357319.1 hypothetical protein [Streptomyces corallincola]
MSGPGEFPEGASEDEYRSVVFDESFVRAARIQEFSARERIADHSPAVRRRRPAHRTLTRQLMVIAVLIAAAFGTAVWMGVRHPYGADPQVRRTVGAARTAFVPLAPVGRVPGDSDPEALYAHSPAARFEAGASGIPLPAVRGTAHFSDSQVTAALISARSYLVRSSLYPEVLTGRQYRPVRPLIDSAQLDQFDRSFTRPAADGRHAPTGWLVRFDPARVRLADERIRARGTLRAAEADPATLEVSSDAVFVYALRPAQAADGTAASLFTVRREIVFRLDHEDLRLGQLQLVSARAEAGPESCGDDSTGYLQPLLAGRTARPGTPRGTDPYRTGAEAALCGTLAPGDRP